MTTENEKDMAHHPTFREEVDIGFAGESAEYAQAPRLTQTANLKDMNPLDITASTEKGEVDGRQQQQPEQGQSGVLTGARLYLVFVALMLCVFVSTQWTSMFTWYMLEVTNPSSSYRCLRWVSSDQTWGERHPPDFLTDQSIVSTAIPVIVSDFNA